MGQVTAGDVGGADIREAKRPDGVVMVGSAHCSRCGDVEADRDLSCPKCGDLCPTASAGRLRPRDVRDDLRRTRRERLRTLAARSPGAAHLLARLEGTERQR
jgi:hypothetical protein